MTHGDRYRHLADVSPCAGTQEKFAELHVQPEGLGTEDYSECQPLRKVLERPHPRSIRRRDLAGETLRGVVGMYREQADLCLRP
jgi:hypothetical protein